MTTTAGDKSFQGFLMTVSSGSFDSAGSNFKTCGSGSPGITHQSSGSKTTATGSWLAPSSGDVTIEVVAVVSKHYSNGEVRKSTYVVKFALCANICPRRCALRRSPAKCPRTYTQLHTRENSRVICDFWSSHNMVA